MSGVAGIVLAAGRSRRMGRRNKLIARVGAQPMVTRVVDALLAADVRPVVAVVGHDAERVRQTLASRDVQLVDNPSYAEGLSSSLRVGLAAVADTAAGALICLGDMPWVQARDLEKLVAAFAPDSGAEICVPVHRGRRGNPVLWGARFFDEMRRLSGDRGAKELIARHRQAVREVSIDHDGVLRDVDTPAQLEGLGDAAGDNNDETHS